MRPGRWPEVGEHGSLPFGRHRFAVRPAERKAQAVEHTERFLRDGLDDFRDALAERDPAPFGKCALGIGLGVIRRHILGSLARRSEEHTSELQSLMRISYAVFCLKKKK